MYSKTEIKLEGTPEEIEAIQAMLVGACYVGNKDAAPSGDCPAPVTRLERFAPFTPSVDPDNIRFWTPDATGVFKYQDRFGEATAEVHRYNPQQARCPDFQTKEPFSPSIYVKHIQAYEGRDVYEPRATALRAAGFQQMRSMRDSEGKYWEHFYLPFVPYGPMPGIKCRGQRPTVKEVMDWICETIRPGVVDVVAQRCAMAVPD